MVAKNRHEIVIKVCTDFSEACDKDISHNILTDKIEKCQLAKAQFRTFEKR